MTSGCQRVKINTADFVSRYIFIFFSYSNKETPVLLVFAVSEEFWENLFYSNINNMKFFYIALSVVTNKEHLFGLQEKCAYAYAKKMNQM